MGFQAYLDIIKARTGLEPDDFHRAAQASGLLASKPTATQSVVWLAADDDLGLGRGHGMALWAVFKDKGWGWVDAGKAAKAGRV